MQIFIIFNIIFWIVYYGTLITIQKSIKRCLMYDPAYMKRFKNDTMTEAEERKFVLLGSIIFAGRFAVVADFLILMSMFFIFIPH